MVADSFLPVSQALARVQRCRAAVDAAADDDDVGRLGHTRTTACTDASVFGMLASSPSEIGFTGGRSR